MVCLKDSFWDLRPNYVISYFLPIFNAHACVQRFNVTGNQNFWKFEATEHSLCMD
jgi:hypothetical protein